MFELGYSELEAERVAAMLSETFAKLGKDARSPLAAGTLFKTREPFDNDLFNSKLGDLEIPTGHYSFLSIADLVFYLYNFPAWAGLKLLDVQVCISALHSELPTFSLTLLSEGGLYEILVVTTMSTLEVKEIENV